MAHPFMLLKAYGDRKQRLSINTSLHMNVADPVLLQLLQNRDAQLDPLLHSVGVARQADVMDCSLHLCSQGKYQLQCHPQQEEEDEKQEQEDILELSIRRDDISDNSRPQFCSASVPSLLDSDLHLELNLGNCHCDHSNTLMNSTKNQSGPEDLYVPSNIPSSTLNASTDDATSLPPPTVKNRTFLLPDLAGSLRSELPSSSASPPDFGNSKAQLGTFDDHSDHTKSFLAENDKPQVVHMHEFTSYDSNKSRKKRSFPFDIDLADHRSSLSMFPSNDPHARLCKSSKCCSYVYGKNIRCRQELVWDKETMGTVGSRLRGLDSNSSCSSSEYACPSSSSSACQDDIINPINLDLNTVEDQLFLLSPSSCSRSLETEKMDLNDLVEELNLQRQLGLSNTPPNLNLAEQACSDTDAGTIHHPITLVDTEEDIAAAMSSKQRWSYSSSSIEAPKPPRSSLTFGCNEVKNGSSLLSSNEIQADDLPAAFSRSPKRICPNNRCRPPQVEKHAKTDQLLHDDPAAQHIQQRHSFTNLLRSWACKETISTRLQLQLDKNLTNQTAKDVINGAVPNLSLGLQSDMDGKSSGVVQAEKKENEPASLRHDQDRKNNYKSESTGATAGTTDIQGMKLLDLLLKCAKAISENEKQTVKTSLGHLYKKASLIGDSMQRLAVYFTEGLVARLVKKDSLMHKRLLVQPTRQELLEAFATLNKVTPFVQFAHFTANQAILEAVEGEARIHVVDMNIEQGCQWPPLIESLARQATDRGQPAASLHITGVGREEADLRRTGAMLRSFATSHRVELDFTPLVAEGAEQEAELLEKCCGMQARREGQGWVTVVNCVMQLHRLLSGGGSGESTVERFAAGARAVGARVVTVVEAEANHNAAGFVGRFVEALHYYAAVFDALDASLPKRSAERLRLERLYLARQIKNILACDGRDRVHRHEPAAAWRRRLRAAGLQQRHFSAAAISQAKLLLRMRPCHGYRLSELPGGFLCLAWQDKNLLTASAWSCS